jgi:hypothetical protein
MVMIAWSRRRERPPGSTARITGMAKRRKPKPFSATKEVKRLARLAVGTPPPSQVQPDDKRKPPKHKKKQIEQELL